MVLNSTPVSTLPQIHSYSADWLYQAVLSLFNEAVRKQVRAGWGGREGGREGMVVQRMANLAMPTPQVTELRVLPVAFHCPRAVQSQSSACHGTSVRQP